MPFRRVVFAKVRAVEPRGGHRQYVPPLLELSLAGAGGTADGSRGRIQGEHPGRGLKEQLAAFRAEGGLGTVSHP